MDNVQAQYYHRLERTFTGRPTPAPLCCDVLPKSPAQQKELSEKSDVLPTDGENRKHTTCGQEEGQPHYLPARITQQDERQPNQITARKATELVDQP